jgi:hypothetical protein
VTKPPKSNCNEMLKGEKMPDLDVEQWLASRKEAGLKINPVTAEVCWIYAQTGDPYGVYPDLPEECRQVGRAYFARAPGSDIWVNFGDLPNETRDTLWEKHKSQLAFPAGLERGSEAGRIVARELQALLENDFMQAAPDLESRIRECLVKWVMQAVPDLESSMREDIVQYVQQLVLKTVACGHSNSSPAEDPS